MVNNYKISIVVPVYNVERYLNKCIHSISEQTYRNLEIILIDDGATDGSAGICDQWAKKDSRIKVFHKKNEGVSVARNMGISYATGVYLCFVDSDDFLPEDAVEKLVRAMNDRKTDLCCGAWAKIGIKSTVFNRYEPEMVSIVDKQRLFRYMNVEEVNGPVAKLYRLDIIRQAELHFVPGILIGEDAIFNYQYLQYCKNVQLIGDTVYFYNKMNIDSVTHTFYKDFCKCSLMTAEEQASNIVSGLYPPESFLVQQIYAKRFMNCIQYISYYRLDEEQNIAQMRCAWELFQGKLCVKTLQKYKTEFSDILSVIEHCLKEDYSALCDQAKIPKQGKQHNIRTIKTMLMKIVMNLKIAHLYGIRNRI